MMLSSSCQLWRRLDRPRRAGDHAGLSRCYTPPRDTTDESQDMSDFRYIGKPVKRLEDLPLLRGRGRFVDDLQFPDMLQAAFVRSPHGHALIRGIDVRAARQSPGVHAVFTLAELAPLLSQERIPLQFRTAQLPADITQFVLAKVEVAFVGEAVAVVIAENRYLAEDA